MRERARIAVHQLIQKFEYAPSFYNAIEFSDSRRPEFVGRLCPRCNVNEGRPSGGDIAVELSAERGLQNLFAERLQRLVDFDTLLLVTQQPGLNVRRRIDGQPGERDDRLDKVT